MPFTIECPSRVLLAEDDESLRKLLADSLIFDGAKVDQACDGQSALELVAANPTGYALVVTDFDMPRLNGIQLIEALLKQGTVAQFILMSAHPIDSPEIRAIVELDAPVRFLQKPFSVHLLSEIVLSTVGVPELAMKRRAQS